VRWIAAIALTISSFLLGLTAASAQTAAPSFPWAPGLAPSFHPPSYLTASPETDTLPASFQIQPSAPLAGQASGGLYRLNLGVVPISLGGTGASDGPTGLTNMINGVLGSLLVKGNNQWTVLAPGQEGSVLQTTNGKPSWTFSAISIPKDSPVLTSQPTNLPNSSVLNASTAGGITIQPAGPTTTIGLDGSVLRTTGGQTIFGVDIFNAPPSLVSGMNFKGLNHNVSITAQDSSREARYSIPDALADCSFVMSEGNQRIDGIKTFTGFALDDYLFGAGTDSYELPKGSDTIATLAAPQSLYNKTFLGLTIDNSPPYLKLLQSGGGYTIDWQATTGPRHYTIPDVNSDGQFVLGGPTGSAGTVPYSDGYGLHYSAPGTIGAVLLSQGTGAPVFGTLSPSFGGTGLGVFEVGDMLQADTPTSFRTIQIIPVASGGTGVGSYNAGDILYATGPHTLAKIPIGSEGQVLTVGAGGVPKWVDK